MGGRNDPWFASRRLGYYTEIGSLPMDSEVIAQKGKEGIVILDQVGFPLGWKRDPNNQSKGPQALIFFQILQIQGGLSLRIRDFRKSSKPKWFRLRGNRMGNGLVSMNRKVDRSHGSTGKIRNTKINDCPGPADFMVQGPFSKKRLDHFPISRDPVAGVAIKIEKDYSPIVIFFVNSFDSILWSSQAFLR